MPTSCSVPGCRNIHKTGGNIQFFGFPLKNEELTKEWTRAVNRQNFIPTKASKVCSDHFIESEDIHISDFLKRPGTYVRHLKPSAVPSVFPTLPTNDEPKSKKRRVNRKKPQLQVISQAQEEERKETPRQSPIPFTSLVVKEEPGESQSPIPFTSFTVKEEPRESLSPIPFNSFTVKEELRENSSPISFKSASVKEEPTDSQSPIPSTSFADQVDNESSSSFEENESNTTSNRGVLNDKAVQTETPIALSRIPFLKKKLRMYQQKLRRRDKKISDLIDVIKTLKEKGLPEKEAEIFLLDHFLTT